MHEFHVILMRNSAYYIHIINKFDIYNKESEILNMDG
jgi:hypothetical protein